MIAENEYVDVGLTVEVVEASDAVTVTMSGELDRDTCPKVEQTLIDLLRTRAPRRLVLDLAQVTFMGSDGIRILVLCRRHAEQLNSGFEIDRAHERVRAVLDMTNLLDILMSPGARDT